MSISSKKMIVLIHLVHIIHVVKQFLHDLNRHFFFEKKMSLTTLISILNVTCQT